MGVFSNAALTFLLCRLLAPAHPVGEAALGSDAAGALPESAGKVRTAHPHHEGDVPAGRWADEAPGRPT